MVENYKTGLKFTHVVDVDKHIAAKIKQIPRLKTLSLQNKDKSFSMRMYQDPNNKLFPSVTTVMPSDSEALNKWKKYMEDSYGGPGAWKWENIRTQRRGNIAHDLMQDTINNKEITFTDSNTKQLYRQMYAYIKKIGQIYCVERELCSYKLGLAGRVDLIAYYNNKLSVIDYKFSNKDRHDAEWFWEKCFQQGWSYAAMLEELTGIKIAQVVILVSSEDLTTNEFISQRKDIPVYIKKMKEFISTFNKQNHDNIKEVLNGSIK